MSIVIGRRGSLAARITASVIAAVVVTGGMSLAPASALEDHGGSIEWSTTWTQEETVSVTESATVDGYVGSGTASATASATASGSAKAPTDWEVYYWASVDAYNHARDAARAKADAIARPVAKQRAEADAKAKAAAGPQMIEWSTTLTQEATVSVTETATIDGIVGTGTATATASATATGTAKAATNWEVYYFAVVDAQTKATAAAQAKADAIARPIAKQRAEDDARAKAAAVPKTITWSTTATSEQTVTVTETATVDGFEGYGTATATASATETGTATAATNWEVYYYATVDAQTKARDSAKAKADAEARALAKQRALADAQAQADAAAQTPDPGTTPVTNACGAQVLKADGSPWACTFADDFKGSALDEAKWSAVHTSTSKFSYGDCFLGLGPNVTVADGSLRLMTKKESAPVTCQLGDHTVTSDYTSGAVTSLNNFSQTYGRVEVRAAMPATDGPGLQSALWMVPDDPGFFGGWPHSGEIDIAEFFSSYADRVIPTLHYDSLTSFAQRTNNDCLVYKPTDFHTYGLVWTPQKLTITVDGTTCLEHTISPTAPLTGSAPFNRPFNLNLTQMLGSGDNLLPAGKSITSATMKVDYVRVWK